MTSSLLIKGHGFEEGFAPIASPEDSALRWLTFGRLGIISGRPYEAITGDQEAVVDVLSGTVALEVEGRRFEPLAGRSDLFSDGPTLICLPPQTSYRLESLTPAADLLVFQSPVEAGEAVTVVRPEDVPMRPVGAGNWLRQVWPGTSIAPGTQRIMVGETVTPPGNWSSYPPHKHDTENPPQEATYEEIYFFLVKPAGGFGVQRIYERREGQDVVDDIFVIEDGDTVIIPRGYHPVVAAPGYQLGYVWALCGHGRSYGAWSDDPAHEWVRNIEPVLATR